MTLAENRWIPVPCGTTIGAGVSRHDTGMCIRSPLSWVIGARFCQGTIKYHQICPPCYGPLEPRAKKKPTGKQFNSSPLAESVISPKTLKSLCIVQRTVARASRGFKWTLSPVKMPDNTPPLLNTEQSGFAHDCHVTVSLASSYLCFSCLVDFFVPTIAPNPFSGFCG
jgi:hypothetical protein